MVGGWDGGGAGFAGGVKAGVGLGWELRHVALLRVCAGLVMASASPDAIAKLIGVYDFQHPSGSFEICLRPGGRFFAPKFQARASWNCTEGGELFIEWGKYGQYTLTIQDPETRSFAGSAVGKPESWRKVRRTERFRLLTCTRTLFSLHLTHVQRRLLEMRSNMRL